MYVIRVYKNGEFIGYDNDADTPTKKLKSAYKWDSRSDARRWRTMLRRENPKRVFHIHRCELVEREIV